MTTFALLETMPDQHRASHRAAGNWGRYPHNGATRQWVLTEDAEEVVESDTDEYAAIVKTLPAVKIAERGNGHPSVGDYVTGSDGACYRIVALLDRIHLPERSGGDEYQWGAVEPADWSDVDDEDLFPARAEVEAAR